MLAWAVVGEAVEEEGEEGREREVEDDAGVARKRLAAGGGVRNEMR